MTEYEKIYNRRQKDIQNNKKLVIQYIRKIQNALGTEDELEKMLEFIVNNTYDPNISNLIYWDDRNLTAEEIYSIAMSYKPIML